MRTLSLLAAGLMIFTLASEAFAQAPKDGPNNPAAIRKVLDQKITLDYNGQSLEDTLDHLGKKTKLNIVVDQMVVQQVIGGMPGIVFANVGGAIGFGGGGMPGFAGAPGGSGPVLLKVDNVKVRTALQKLLNQYNLTFVILGDSVLITTEEAGQMRQMRQRISVDVKDQPLIEALDKLAHDTGVNLLIDTRQHEKAKHKVSLQLEDATLETAMRLLTELADLGSVSVGNVLFVTNSARAEKMRQDNPPTHVNNMFPGGLPPININRAGAAMGVGAPPPPVVMPDTPPPAKKDTK